MPHGPSRLDDGTDISRMTVAQIDEALALRHAARRRELLRMQGDLVRLERQVLWLVWIITGTLAVLALYGMLIS